MTTIQERRTVFQAGLDALTSDWPDDLKAEDPGRDATMRSRLQWYEQHKDHDPADWESEEESDEQGNEESEEEESTEEKSAEEKVRPGEGTEETKEKRTAPYRFSDRTDASW